MRSGILFLVCCFGTMLTESTAQESKPVTINKILERAEIEALLNVVYGLLKSIKDEKKQRILNSR